MNIFQIEFKNPCSRDLLASETDPIGDKNHPPTVCFISEKKYHSPLDLIQKPPPHRSVSGVNRPREHGL